MIVAETESGDGSRRKFQVAYLGEKADDHAMDVDALAPALLSFSKLLRAANEELNSERATVKVLVASEFEHKCFSINFELVQILDKIKDFLKSDDVKNANDLLQKIGIIGGAAGGAIASVFAYLKWRAGRKVETVGQVTGSPGTLILKLEGDNNTVNVGADVFRLAHNKQVLEAVEGTLTPIKDAKEARAIEFKDHDKPVAIYKVEEVAAIIASCEGPGDPIPIEVIEEAKPQNVTGTLYSYGPVYDSKAPKWRFLYKNKPIYADIKGTSIAKDAMRRGGSLVNDRYKVKMDVLPPDTEDGTPHYRITEVLDFTPADEQISMALRKPRKKKTAAKKTAKGAKKSAAR